MKNMSNKHFPYYFLIIFLSCSLSLKAQIFEEVKSFGKPVSMSSVEWGDYNNDGWLDILLMGWHSSKDASGKLVGERISQVYENKNGSGDFISIVADLKPVNSVIGNNLAWADVNNDNFLDIILTGQDGNDRVAHLYQNDGKGKFAEVEAGIPGVHASSVDWGDYDNDGKIDLLIAGLNPSDNPITRVYRNNGTSWEDIGANLQGVFYGAVSWADYNHDGRLDIVITGRDNNKNNYTKLYLNNGNGFDEDTRSNLIAVSRSSLAWGDYDNDGQIDLFITGIDNNDEHASQLYRNNGSILEAVENLNFHNLSGGDAVWGDYDNDGKLDLLLSGIDEDNNRITKLYRNEGYGAFGEVGNTGLLNVAVGSMAWGDYDNDGKLDLIITGQGGREVDYQTITKVYRNTTEKTNQKPGVPTNLTTEVSGNAVTINWSKADDSETPQNELTYNVHFGLEGASGEILSAMADFETGKRSIVEAGNVGHQTSWTIYNLPAGNYHWSVQTIDNTFEGSEFAEQQTFVIE